MRYSYLRNGYKIIYPLQPIDNKNINNNNNNNSQELNTTVTTMNKLGDGFPPLIFDIPQYTDQGYYQCMMEVDGMMIVEMTGGVNRILSSQIDVQFAGKSAYICIESVY